MTWDHAYVEEAFRDEDGPGEYLELHEETPKGCRVRGSVLLQWPCLFVTSRQGRRVDTTFVAMALGEYSLPRQARDDDGC